MKRNLLIMAAVMAVVPPLMAQQTQAEEIPVLDVGGNKFPRSIYNRIQIKAGTPAVVKTEPALKIGNNTPVLRSVYNTIEVHAGTPAVTKTETSLKVGSNTPVPISEYSKISVDAQAKSYTLVSKVSAAANKTYSFQAAPKISSVMHTYTVKPAVVGTYTLKAKETSSSKPAYNRAQAQVATDLTYNFKDNSRISSVMHTYEAVKAVSGTYTLLSNDPDNHAHQEFIFGQPSQVRVMTHGGDVLTGVENVEQEAEAMMNYHRATQTLRAGWTESRMVLISNVSGQIVLRGRLGGDVGVLSVSSLPAGVYIAVSRGIERRQTLKFIK